MTTSKRSPQGSVGSSCFVFYTMKAQKDCPRLESLPVPKRTASFESAQRGSFRRGRKASKSRVEERHWRASRSLSVPVAPLDEENAVDGALPFPRTPQGRADAADSLREGVGRGSGRALPNLAATAQEQGSMYRPVPVGVSLPLPPGCPA